MGSAWADRSLHEWACGDSMSGAVSRHRVAVVSSSQQMRDSRFDEWRRLGQLAIERRVLYADIFPLWLRTDGLKRQWQGMNRRDLGLEGAYKRKSMTGGRIASIRPGKVLYKGWILLIHRWTNKRWAYNQGEFSHLRLIAVRRKWGHSLKGNLTCQVHFQDLPINYSFIH